jgi:erythromycin esterase-like protein/predicted phosphoribosyltransferase
VVVPFHDRRDAGRQLGRRLREYAGRPDVVVLGLARGGLPVAFEVAQALDLPLDVVLVRKLGVPGQEELAMGAIASGGARVLNDELMSQWTIPDADVRRVEARERRELERRERLYRGGRLPIPLEGRTVLLIDDGLATGSTMRAAAIYARKSGANRVVAAAPVAAPEVCARLTPEVDAAICLAEPNPFWAVGIWFDDFRPTSDEEVRVLLQKASEGPHSNPGSQHALSETLPARLRAIARRIDPHGRSLEQLAESLADARFVMICDASDGTHEFYVMRAEITKRLVTNHGFRAVAVEADWPDADRVDRYVRGRSNDRSADEALGGFDRFPRWKWRNTVVRDFVEWMRAFNDYLPRSTSAVGFYGLDLYSVQHAVETTIDYLARVDPDAAKRALRRFSASEQFGARDATLPDQGEPHEEVVVQHLIEHWEQTAAESLRSERKDDDDLFPPEYLASLRENAADFYRAIFRGDPPAWGLRNRHMADTLDRLMSHLERGEDRGRIVVWGHDSHIGERTTSELGLRGAWGLGQEVRQQHGDDVRLVGMTTYQGTVTAASGWDGPIERKRIEPGPPESYESLFHDVGEPAFLLMLRQPHSAETELTIPRPHRDIGAIYESGFARMSDYHAAPLGDQFDVLIHLDETTALEPLDRTTIWEQGAQANTSPQRV